MTSRSVVAIIVTVAMILSRAAGTWADGGHAHGPETTSATPAVVWLVGIGLTILVVLVLTWQARAGGDYLRRVRGLSRNARSK